jgi:hypothetical protein
LLDRITKKGEISAEFRHESVSVGSLGYNHGVYSEALLSNLDLHLILALGNKPAHLGVLERIASKTPFLFLLQPVFMGGNVAHSLEETDGPVD